MVITLGNIVFGGKGNGGSSTASAYVVPNGMRFQNSTFETFSSEGLDFSQKTDFSYCWNSCSYLTEFPLLDLHNGFTFAYAWHSCNKLATFPMVDVSGGNYFSNAWHGCRALTSFPQLNVSKGIGFRNAWYGCIGLTEFPMLDLHNGTDFYMAWYGCSSLTSFPQLDLSSGTDFGGAWTNCKKLTNLGGFGAISADIDLHWSTLLTAESLMNVITQAATVTGKTMKFGSDNLAKLTDEQKAVATNKGWTLA